MPNNKLWLHRLERQGHPYHIVNRSPWPFFFSIATLSVTVGGVLYMHRYQGGGSLLFWGIIFLFTIMLFWFRDVIIEGTFEGHHTKKVQAGLRFGMKLFIVTEVMFFFSFFWAFFHSALAPHTFIGIMWPPRGIIPMYKETGIDIPETDLNALKIGYTEFKTATGNNTISFEDWVAWEQPTKAYILDKPHWVRLRGCVNAARNDDGYRWAFCYLPLFNPYTIPLAATFILLSSGLTLHIAGMWFKYANNEALWPFSKEIRENLFKFGITFGKTKETLNTPTRSAAYYSIIFWLSLTILLGLIFTVIQTYEYVVLLPFAINDSIFGSCFYMLTGFHGAHVILGTLGLVVCLYRHIQGHFTRSVHVGFECASWYWHFVDGVWLFVYSIVYWWSAPLKRPYLWFNEIQNEIKDFECGTKALSWNSVIKENHITKVTANVPDSVILNDLEDDSAWLNQEIAENEEWMDDFAEFITDLESLSMEDFLIVQAEILRIDQLAHV